ncbi:transmembrane protein 42 [Toxorhynchites rutilus septentrionalis]|uniref:transmembrane protein 42 n=1 Tax=Toxorhynchites rutilus septentrionalis TaxID=329112 RepID=UPI00247A5F1D|nr:transmembrane protein 42 [Toxorhynchites rutilus septentrionalis]
MNQNKPYYAVVSGLCAALASFSGKLSSYSQHLARHIGNEQLDNFALILCLGIMVLLNACVWRFFVKALHSNGGTLVASLVSAATNYIVSAIIGWMFFHEKTTAVWWFGTVLVLGGLLLIVYDGEAEKTKSKPS